MDTDCFNNYIEDRFQSNYSLLLNNPKYIALNAEFNTKYRDLGVELTKEQLKMVEHLLEIKNNIFSEDMYLAYKVGFTDGFNLKKDIN